MTTPNTPKMPVPLLRFTISMTPDGKRLDYTADDMASYGRAMYEAGRAEERAAILQMLPGGYSVDPQQLADEIRARTKEQA